MTGPRTIAYQSALDGMRAVAVAMVLVFHGGFGWMSGGYVGVSVFFTLSGYLITTLLLVEHGQTGAVRLGRFYARRMKRLLPASVVCLAGVGIMAAFDIVDDTTTLRRDLLGALFHVANWVKLGGDDTYAQLTNATLGRIGPLEHYWSLAIEEQFYWLWPVVLLVVFRLARSPRAVTTSIVVLALAAGVAAPVIAAVWGPDAAYWATPARIGEILVGAALAAVLRAGTSWRRWSMWLAPLGSIVVVWAAVTWPPDRGPAYAGWLPVFALASAAIIVGLQHPSPVRRALSVRPIVWVGSISYGLYLFHWPLFVVLTEDRVGVQGTWLFAVRVGATIAVAATSARLVEGPLRRWSPPPSRPLMAAALATTLLAIVVVAVDTPATATIVAASDRAAAAIVSVDASMAPLVTVAAVTSTSGPPATSDPVAASPAAAPSTVLSTSALPAPVSAPAVSRPVRVVVVGDSTATYTAAGLVSWAVDHPDSAQVTDASLAGCGFVRDGEVPTDGAIDWASQCAVMLDDRLPVLLSELQPDVVMLMVTMRDVEDRRWNDAEGVISPFDERFRQRLFDDYLRLADELAAAGVGRIGWVLAPHPIAPFQGEQRKMLDPARYEVQFDVIAEIASRRPELVHVLDLRAWLEQMGGSTDGSLRPDGLHWSETATRWVSDNYLAGSLLAVAVS